MYLKSAILFWGLAFMGLAACGQTAEELDSMVDVYFNQGDYAKALPFAEKAVEIVNKNGKEKNSEYLNAVNNLAILYKKTGSYSKAEPLYKLATELKKQQFGDTSEVYSFGLNQVGNLYDLMGDNQQAAEWFKEAIKVYEHINNPENYSILLGNLVGAYEKLGRYKDVEPLYILQAGIIKTRSGENPDYASKLIDLADLYETIEKYPQAESLYVRTSEIYKQYLGDTSRSYASSLRFLGRVYYKTSQYKKAEEVYLLSASIRKQQQGENSSAYGNILNDLALLYNDLGEYTKAEELYLKSGEITIVNEGLNSRNHATDLNNLALLYHNMGNYNKAIAVYIQSMNIRVNLLGAESADAAESYDNLASAYKDNGEFAKSEEMYLKALSIRKKILGEMHSDYASTLAGLGLVYRSLGLLEKAETFFTQASVIYRTVLGEHSSDYAIALDNLGNVYNDEGYYADAEKVYLKAIEIKKEVYGEKHFSYASTLLGLGSVYQKQHQFDKAEPFYLKAIEIKKMLLGEESVQYGTAVNDLAIFYDAKGDYAQAIKLYNQAIEIYKKQLGEEHPYFPNVLGNLGVTYQKSGDNKRAEPLLIKTNDLQVKNLLSMLTILSEQDKQTLLNDRAYKFEIANSFLYLNGGSGPLRKSNLNVQLVFKSLSLSDSRNMLAAIRNSKDSSLKKLFEEWLGYKTVLARQYTLPRSERLPGIDSLEKNAETVEKQLNRRSEEFKKQQGALHITMEDIQHSLADDEAAIEFVRFSLFNKKWTDSVMYAAYIFKKRDSFPAFIPLCEEKQLQKLFSSSAKNTSALVASFYRGAGGDNDNVSVSKGDSLYHLIWEPLEPYLKNIKKISYSPAGKLYTIAYSALPAGDKKILLDKYELQQYSSTRQIGLRKDTKVTAPESIALFGDAAFTMDSLQLVKAENPSKENSAPPSLYASTRGTTNYLWNNLPGTAEEVKKIQQLFLQNKKTTTIYVQQRANEENLKLLSNRSPQILHIATHGFFLPEPDKAHDERGNIYSLADDPLLRSGIILAGGNYTWSGREPIKGIEDGVATAYEISQLDLGKTELVVLSACETALGDIKGSEGVFGLQRAFKMAGVNKLIVSLWQVPDKETAELMTAFYSNWLSGETIENAFYKAQSEMRKKYAPFYWAAFVLVE